MAGRKARQAREAEARLATQTPCDCGGGWHEREDGRLEIIGHDFETPCAFLRWCSETDAKGFCAQCGYRLIRHLGWDRDWQCVVRSHRCPKGCQHGMSMVYAEDATQEERDKLGLVLVPR